MYEQCGNADSGHCLNDPVQSENHLRCREALQRDGRQRRSSSGRLSNHRYYSGGHSQGKCGNIKNFQTFLREFAATKSLTTIYYVKQGSRSSCRNGELFVCSLVFAFHCWAAPQAEFPVAAEERLPEDRSSKNTRAKSLSNLGDDLVQGHQKRVLRDVMNLGVTKHFHLIGFTIQQDCELAHSANSTIVVCSISALFLAAKLAGFQSNGVWSTLQ